MTLIWISYYVDGLPHATTPVGSFLWGDILKLFDAYTQGRSQDLTMRGGAETHKRNFFFWLTHILLSFLNRINMPVTVIRGNIRGNIDLSTDRNTTTQDM